MRMSIRLIIFVVLFTVLGSSLSYAKPIEFQGATIDGQHFVFSDYIKDKEGCVVVFWTTWCPYCKKEVDNLIKEQNVFKKNNIGLVLINPGEPRSSVSSYFARQKFSFPVVMDFNLEITRSAGIKSVPSIFLVDKNREILRFSFSLPADFLKILGKK